MQYILQEQGYHTTFVPLTIRDREAYQYQEGLLLASRLSCTTEVHYYHGADSPLVVFDKPRYRLTMKKAVIYAKIDSFHVATTHFTWTADGASPGEHQQHDIHALLHYLDTLPSHILCGDFNIPRGKSSLYEEYLVPRYTDAVPATYTSSLDPAFHRHACKEDKQHLFSDFMVDYIFTQTPYTAEHARLVFGVSDHAAVVADVVRNDE